MFPLNAHILPGGRLPLRIFEPRYTRMVTEVTSGRQRLCMCMLDPDVKAGTLVNMYPIVTEVDIIDFEQLSDGLLGITVQGVSKWRLSRVWADPDGLKMGTAAYLPDWPTVTNVKPEPYVGQQLRALLTNQQELRALKLEFQHDSNWICQRWLELLPMDPNDKQLLIEQPDCQAAIAFLNKVIRITGEQI